MGLLKKGLLLLFFITITIRCQTPTPSSMEWTYFNFDKDSFFGKTMKEGSVTTEYTTYDIRKMLICTDSLAFMYGNDADNINKYESAIPYDAIVLRTTDRGKTITKKVLGKGAVDQIVQAGTTLFLVTKSKIPGSPEYGGEYFYTLYQSTDWGDNWIEIPKPKAFIGGLDFYNPDICIASFKENGQYDYYLSKDKLKTWHKLDYQPETGYIFISASAIQSLENDTLITYNFDTNTVSKTKVKVPVGKIPDGLYVEPLTKKPYLGVKDPDSDSENRKGFGDYFIEEDLLIEYPKGIIGAVPYGNYFQTIQKNGAYSQHIWSNDRGKTWHKEDLGDFFTFQDFYYKDQVWAFVVVVKEIPQGNCLAIGRPKK